MTITKRECDLMVEALEYGEKVLSKVYGKVARMRRDEKQAAKMLIRSGKDVPVQILRMVCMGLEYLYFCDNRQNEGIQELLSKLAQNCAYQRFGMAMLDARRYA